MSSSLTHPKYRPDIDGLRAIAVVSVVLYHAFPAVFRGGFIGVDIFFVISGFLISSIIIKSIQNQSFTLYEFYARRVSRIFPALTIVLCVCFIFGWHTLFADEFKQLGSHIFAGATFLSNIFLWRESGYFDTSADFKPLLHLWSLGIEEQFYIFYPMLLMYAYKRRWNLLKTIFSVLLVSFFFSIIKIYHDPTGAFYSPLTRFWELLIGGVFAYVSIQNPKSLFGLDKTRQDKTRQDKTRQDKTSYLMTSLNAP